MSYVALRQIRFGDGFLEAGEPVPVEPGRDYGMMVRLGEVAELPDDAPIASPVDAADDRTGGDLNSLSRSKLNSLAHDAGVEKPESLPNKDAVVDAIRAAGAE